MIIFWEHTNVLKKASGSWAEPYSLAPLLVLRGALVYSGYTTGFPGCRDSDLGIRTGIPVIRGYIFLKIEFL